MENPNESPTNDVKNDVAAQNAVSDKEFNFRKIENALKEERERRFALEEEIKSIKNQQLASRNEISESDDDDDDVYATKKVMDKRIRKAQEQLRKEAERDAQQTVTKMLAEARQKDWLKANPDFYEVMQHADKFAEKDPEWAEEFLRLPEGFERQKMVYKTIKALNMHKKEEPKPSVQDQIKNNRKGYFYSPSEMGNAPYQSQSDFSPTGQKSAYDKMQELKRRLTG